MLRPEDLSDQQVLARTLWAEARGQGPDGMLAVACVIRNRARNPGWWGGPSLRSVCLKPLQFSCWNASDPQFKLIRADAIRSLAFDTAMGIAAAVMADAVADITHGADHYCTAAVAPKTSWAKSRTPVAKIGAHWFYRIGLRG